MNFKEVIKDKFKDLKLPKPRKINNMGFKWAHGDVWHVKTLFNDYIVLEAAGKVKTIKDKRNIYYRAKGGE